MDAFGLQWYGVTCGPEKTGPPIGWFVITIMRPAPPGVRAVRMFLPTTRPVTSPEKLPSSRAANADVMSLPFRVDPHRRRVGPGGELHGDEGVAARDEIGAVRQHVDRRDSLARRTRDLFAPASASPIVTASAIAAAIAAETRNGVALCPSVPPPLGGQRQAGRP